MYTSWPAYIHISKHAQKVDYCLHHQGMIPFAIKIVCGILLWPYDGKVCPIDGTSNLGKTRLGIKTMDHLC